MMDDRPRRQAELQYQVIERGVKRLRHAREAARDDNFRLEIDPEFLCAALNIVTPSSAPDEHYHQELLERYLNLDEAANNLLAEVVALGHTDDRHPEDVNLVLSWGGPSVRLLRQDNIITLQYQDWLQPWTDYDGLLDESILDDFIELFEE